jgi:hypothetical protein
VFDFSFRISAAISCNCDQYTVIESARNDQALDSNCPGGSMESSHRALGVDHGSIAVAQQHLQHFLGALIRFCRHGELKPSAQAKA